MSSVGRVSERRLSSAEMSGVVKPKTRRNTFAAAGGGGGGSIAVRIEQSETAQYVTTLFDGGAADSANSNSAESSGRQRNVVSSTFALAQTSSTQITTVKTSSATSVEVVVGSYDQGHPHAHAHRRQSHPGRARSVEAMRSRRTPALNGVSAQPSKEADKLPELKPGEEEERADVAKKRAPSSSRKKSVKPPIIPIITNSVRTTQTAMTCSGHPHEFNRDQIGTAINSLQRRQINEPSTPYVEIVAAGDKDAAKLKASKTKKSLAKKRKKLYTSAASRKATQNKKAKKSPVAEPSCKATAKVIDSNLSLREKLGFLTESQLEGLRSLKVLRPENVLNLRLWELNLIGINKGEQLEGILSILANGHSGEVQKKSFHEQQNEQIIMNSHDESKDIDDDEEQALVIDETASTFQEIENITRLPDDLSLCRRATDENPISLTPPMTRSELNTAVDKAEKSLILTKNSNAPYTEKRLQIESIQLQLSMLMDAYLKIKAQENNNSINNIDKDEQQQPPPLKEQRDQKIFTFNLPVSTCIFQLADGQIIKDGNASNTDQTKPKPNVAKEPVDLGVKRMTLRSKSKSDERLTPSPEQIQIPETKETKNKSTSACCENNSSYSRLKIVPNPAVFFSKNNKQLTERSDDRSSDCCTSKTMLKPIKFVRIVNTNGTPMQPAAVTKPFEFVDLINDKSYLKAGIIQKNSLNENASNNDVCANAKSYPTTATADVPKNPSIAPESKKEIFVNANLPYPPIPNETQDLTSNNGNITLPSNAVTSIVTPKHIANYVSKFNFNLGEIRKNLCINTLHNQHLTSTSIQQKNCAEKSPHSNTVSNVHLEDQFINPPEAFSFYSSPESSQQFSQKSVNNENSTIVTTDLSPSMSTENRKGSFCLYPNARDNKNSPEYQHAFNTFVDSEFDKNLQRRDSNSSSASRSGDKTELLSSSKLFTSTLLLPSSNNNNIGGGGAKVTSQKIIVAAPLKSTLASLGPATPQETDLRNCLIKMHCKKLDKPPSSSIKQEHDIGHLTTVKLDKCTDSADSTTMTPHLIYKDNYLKPKDKPFHKTSTVVRPELGPHLVKIKKERSADADSTTRSPTLTYQQSKMTIRIKKECGLKEKSSETENHNKEQQVASQPKEKKIVLKRSFNIRRKEQTDAAQSPPKRSKYASLRSQKWLQSPKKSPSPSFNKCSQRKKCAKLAISPTPTQRRQRQHSSGYSSSTSTSRVVYTHLKPQTSAAAATTSKPLSPHTHLSQSSSTSTVSIRQENDRNDSRHPIENFQKKRDLRQELENRRASICSHKSTKEYQNDAFEQRHHPKKALLSPKKELYVPPAVVEKSWDEKKMGRKENYQGTNSKTTIGSSAEEVDDKDKLRQLISHKVIRKISFDSKSDDCKNNNQECSETKFDALSIASPTFSPLTSVEIASPASPKNSLSYYTSAPVIDGQMSYPAMPYMLYKIVIPKEINEPRTNNLQIKTGDPRLSKFIKKNTAPNYSDSIMSPTSVDPRLRQNVQFSDTLMLQQQQQQQQYEQQQQQQYQQQLHHQQQQQQQQQPQPNMVLYNCLQRSPWYQGLMSTMKIQINQCISELVRALNNFQKERLVDHTAVFDIFKIDCACELMEIMRSLCISIDMNGVITDTRNFLSSSGGGFGAAAGVRCSLVPSTAIKATYSFVQPELPSSAARVVSLAPAPPPPPPEQSPMQHYSPFVSRYLEAPQAQSWPRRFDARRQCGSKAPHMSRLPPLPPQESYMSRQPPPLPPQERYRSYERPPQQNRGRYNQRSSPSHDREGSFETTGPPPLTQEREHSYESSPTPRMSAAATKTCLNGESEEECWD